MKIVNREYFMDLPDGTVYSECESESSCEGLFIKGETWTTDFVMMSLIGNIKAGDSGELMEKYDRAQSGESVEMDFDCYGRDGSFNEDQLFAVYERPDLNGLIAVLKDAIGA